MIILKNLARKGLNPYDSELLWKPLGITSTLSAGTTSKEATPHREPVRIYFVLNHNNMLNKQYTCLGNKTWDIVLCKERTRVYSSFINNRQLELLWMTNYLITLHLT